MRFVGLVVVAGCGRIAFDARTDASSVLVDDVATDASGDAFPVTTCPQAGTLICESFDAPLGAAWTGLVTSGSVGHATTRSVRGPGALETTIAAHGAATNPRAEMQIAQGLMGAVTGTLYARVFIYISSPRPAAFDQFMTFADTNGNGIALGVNSQGRITTNDFTDGNVVNSATLMPLDQWVCLVLSIPSNTMDMTRAFLDDVELTDAAQTNPVTHPPPDHLFVGQVWPSNPIALPMQTSWIDELIVDTQPITCAQ